MKTFISILLLALAAAAGADVYKWIAPDGSVIYTDQPRQGADLIPIPVWRPPVPLPPPPSPALERPAPAVAPRPVYDEIRIRKPSPGSHVREEGEGLEIVVDVKPELKTHRGHLIQILLDGQPHGDAAPSQTQRLLDVKRGSHTAAAQVLDFNKRVIIESGSESFFYRRPAAHISAPFLYPSDVPARAAPWFRPAPMFPRADHVPPRPRIPLPSGK